MEIDGWVSRLVETSISVYLSISYTTSLSLSFFLSSSLSLSLSLSIYQVPAQQDACRAWLRSWVCTFEFRPRGGRSGAPLDFAPRHAFAMPPLPVEGAVGLAPSLHETLETSFSAQVALGPPLISWPYPSPNPNPNPNPHS